MTETTGSRAASTSTSPSVLEVSAIAVPFVGLIAGIEGAATNISSTALVSASRALHMSGGTQALAASVLTLAIAATVISTGLIADRMGRREMLIISLVVSCVGQLIVAVSPVAAVYLIGLAVTGLGMGAMYGAAFGFLAAIVPREKFASAMGVFTASFMVSTIVFTFAGGVMVSIDWRLAFLLLPVVLLVCALAVRFVLPEIEKLRGGALDLLGQALLALGVMAFLYGCSQLANSLTSVKTIAPIVGGVLLLIGFFVREAKSEHRFFPVSMFRSPVFLAAVCAGFVYNFGTAVAFLQITNLWQYVTGLKPSEVSVWQLPLLLSGVIAGILTGRLIGKRITNRVAILGGAVMLLSGAVLVALVHSSHSLLAFLPGLLLIGAGVIVASVPYGSLILREAPAKYLGPVTSSRTTIGQIFYTLGFAISMVMVDRLTDIGVIAQLKADGVSPTNYGAGLDALNVYVSTGQKPTSTVGQQALQGAAASYGHAFSITIVSAGVIAALVAGAAFLLLGKGRDVAPAAAPGPTTAPDPTPASSAV
ncbi:MAG: MFS transporter [Acidimicrobiia bacterium]|nr:MFS transporter [Acidimicrobiia bacterium]